MVADGRELEAGGVAGAASLPGADSETFQLEAVSAGESAVAVSGIPDLDEAHAVIMLVDPYTFPIEPLLGQLATDNPGLPVIGGLAGAGAARASPRSSRTSGWSARGRGRGHRGVDIRTCLCRVPARSAPRW